MSRKAITILVAIAVTFFVGFNLASDSEAGESVAAPGCSGSVQAGCSGSVPVVSVFRRAPIRSWFANRRIQRAARGCSAPQAVPVMVQPVQVISVAPIRLFRNCANGTCR
jgi:hypothetical protein